jgi:sulfatase modifying factor 1
MSDFDPYHIWLGIPETERPISKYRLLALTDFEDNREVISAAAERQTIYLRTLQAGEHAVLVAELLNEVSQARVTLLNAEQKAEYDEELREQQTPEPVSEPTPPPIPVVQTPPPTPVVVRGTVTQDFPVSVVQTAKKPLRRRQQEIWKRPAVIGVSVVGVIGVLALLMSFMFSGDAEPVASNTANPIPAEVAVETAAVEKDAAVTAALAKGDWKAVLSLYPNNNEGLRMKAVADKAAADKAAADKAAADKAAMDKAAMDKAAMDKAAMDKAAMDKAAMDKAAMDKAAIEKAAALINNVYTEQSQWIDPTLSQCQPTKDSRLAITHAWFNWHQPNQPILNIVMKIENRSQSTELSLQRQFSNQNVGDFPYKLSPSIPLIRLSTGDGRVLKPEVELVNRTIPRASAISETYQIELTIEQVTELDHVRVLVPRVWFNQLGYWGFAIPQIMFTSTKPAQTSVQIARDPITNTFGMTLNKIPAGTFTMGSPEGEEGRRDNETQHPVTISKAFYMQTTEVTQGQWKAVMGKEARRGKEGADYPVIYVRWNDVVTFCNKLTEKEGKTYRLPTEAEWEYACRAGTKTTWSFGNDEHALSDHAWWQENAVNTGEEYAHQVGLKKPNAWGLYDMYGNVHEWCHDYYEEDYYQESPINDPKGPASGSSRVFRGGSWSSGTRSAFRVGAVADVSFSLIGFRVVRELD